MHIQVILLFDTWFVSKVKLIMPPFMKYVKKSWGNFKRTHQSLLCFPLPATYIIVLLMMYVRLALNNKGIYFDLSC